MTKNTSKKQKNSTTSFVSTPKGVETYTSKGNVLTLSSQIGDWTDSNFINHPQSYDIDDIETLLINEGWGKELAEANSKIGQSLLQEELSLEALRLNKGFSQKQLAEKMGLGQYQISHYENGRNKPGFEVLKKLSKILSVDMNTLFKAIDK